MYVYKYSFKIKIYANWGQGPLEAFDKIKNKLLLLIAYMR